MWPSFHNCARQCFFRAAKPYSCSLRSCASSPAWLLTSISGSKWWFLNSFILYCILYFFFVYCYKQYFSFFLSNPICINIGELVTTHCYHKVRSSILPNNIQSHVHRLIYTAYGDWEDPISDTHRVWVFTRWGITIMPTLPHCYYSCECDSFHMYAKVPWNDLILACNIWVDCL